MLGQPISNIFTPEAIQSERAARVASLKQAVKTPTSYFKSQDINDVASAVSGGLDDEIDIRKTLAGTVKI